MSRSEWLHHARLCWTLGARNAFRFCMDNARSDKPNKD